MKNFTIETCAPFLRSHQNVKMLYPNYGILLQTEFHMNILKHGDAIRLFLIIYKSEKSINNMHYLESSTLFFNLNLKVMGYYFHPNQLEQ